MRNIAFIMEKFTDTSLGGEPTINYNLIQHLQEQGYNIDIYCKDNETNNNNFKVYDNFKINKGKYIKQIAENNYNLLISTRFGLKFSEIKADIYTIHSHSDLYSQKSKFGIWYNILKPKQKRIKNEIKNLNANKNATFVFCSEQLKNDYYSLCNLDNTFVINPYPNCTPLNMTKNKNDIFTFGISATGFQNKGGYLILKSAFLLKLSGENFKLKIIYKKNLGILQKLLVKILGLTKQVEFLPKQNDMHSFYESIDCLCMPSQLESFGMVAAEAMSFGLPVIVSSTSGVTEIIDNAQNGFIFDFSNNKVFNLYKQMKLVFHNDNKFETKKYGVSSKLTNKENYNQTFLNIILKHNNASSQFIEGVSGNAY